MYGSRIQRFFRSNIIVKNENTPPRAVGIEQQIVLDLANGVRKPKNEKEKRLLAQIEEIENKGGMIDLPFD